jgi:hypothetical protein
MTSKKAYNMLPSPELDAALKDYIDATKTQASSLCPTERVESDLLTAYDQHFKKQTWYERVWATLWPKQCQVAASCAVLSLIFGVWIFLNLAPSMSDQPSMKAMNAHSLIAPEDSEKTLFVLDTKMFELEAGEIEVISTQIPHSVLATLGIGINPQIAGESTKAEIYMSMNKQVLAVRF